ncbi:hypothetical protein ACOSP7_013281 [Xanthoceras sorbifolium]
MCEHKKAQHELDLKLLFVSTTSTKHDTENIQAVIYQSPIIDLSRNFIFWKLNQSNYYGNLVFARSSRLILDKANLGFCFPCDGPGRGGTCQVSAWDHVFLGLFWMYNAISVVIFHFSWKMQLDVWRSINDQRVVTHITGGNFAQSSILLMGGSAIFYGHRRPR